MYVYIYIYNSTHPLVCYQTIVQKGQKNIQYSEQHRSRWILRTPYFRRNNIQYSEQHRTRVFYDFMFFKKSMYTPLMSTNHQK